MTRSVEIPEEAVLAATRALAKTFATNKPIAGTKDFEVDARAALEAALPYLAPAGDGGLREALEESLDNLPVVHYENGYPSQAMPKAELIAHLALHPAAPAVPQPVDREALRDLLSDFVDSDDCWYDHHGYCQAHGWFRTDPACPHARAKAVLAGEQEQVESPE